MSRYRLVVNMSGQGPMRSVSVNLKHRGEALIAAQRFDAPAELWDGDRKLCSINRSDGLWIISE